MRRVAAAGSLRRRLAVTYAIVAAVATGALALGTVFFVSSSRLDDAVESSLARARTNLLFAGTVLGESSTRRDVADLLELYGSRPGFEAVAVVEGEPLPARF